MTPASPCPEGEDLERFALGQVSETEMALLEQHLLQCARCTAALTDLRAEDALSAALRAQAAVLLPDDARLHALMGRLEGLRLPPRDEGNAPTLATWDPEQPSADAVTPSAVMADDATTEVYDFLAPPAAAGEVGRLGPYRILGVLGAGGMGVVFRAEDTQLHRAVALKVLLPGRAPGPAARQRFLREARAAAAVEHDHIVAIFQVGEDRGVPYVAMPLLRGESLEDRLRREGVLPVPEVLRIGREIAEGLAAAHARGLVHRDIKPANIWLEGERGRVKVLDFGLARAATPDAALTQTGAIVGTPAYMAPEQAQGEAVDARADLFSLGCVLYRMATGRPPFRGATALAILSALALQRPAPPRRLNPAVPQALADLILRLLAREPAGRPASAPEVAAALQAIERGLPPPGPAPRPARRRVAAWVIAALLLVGLAGVAWYFAPALWQTPGETESPAPGVPPADTALTVVPFPPPAPGLAPRARLSGFGVPVWAVAFSPDSRRLAGAGAAQLRVVDPLTGADVVKLDDARAPFYCVTFRPDGGQVAGGGWALARVWDAATGRVVTQRGMHPETRGLAYTADGKDLLAASIDWRRDANLPRGCCGHVLEWDLTGAAVVRRYAVLSERIFQALVPRPGGTQFAVASGLWDPTTERVTDGAVDLWDPADPTPRHFRPGTGSGVYALAFRPDGRLLACGCDDGSVTVWDVDRGEALYTVRGHGAVCRAVAFSADGRFLLSAYSSSKALVWDAAGGRPVRTLCAEYSGFHTVACSPDGRLVALGSHDGYVYVWDAGRVFAEAGAETPGRTYEHRTE